MSEEVKQKGPTWKIPTDRLRFDTWKETLVDAKGNITQAAELASIDRSYATRLTKKFKLNEFAAQLRLEAGASRTRYGDRRGVVTGRPTKT